MTNILSHTALRTLAVVAALSMSAALYAADEKAEAKEPAKAAADAKAPAKAAAEVKNDAKPAADAKAPAKPAEPAVGVKEKLTREVTDLDAQKCRDEGRDFDRKGEYEKAIDKFLEAKGIWEELNTGKNGSKYSRDIAQMTKAIADTYCRWAKSLFEEAQKDANAGKIDDAIKKCEQAAEMYPILKEDMDAAIEHYKKMQKSMEFKKSTEMSEIDPTFEENQSSMEVKLQQAKLSYKIGRYDEARQKFESILAKDPYNDIAIEYMRRIYLKMIKTGERRQDLFAAEAVNDVAWKPVTPILVTTQDENEEVAVQPQEKADPSQQLQQKLDSIKFKSLVFEDTPLSDVIDTLRRRSQELDPSDGKEGVNFVLRTTGSAAPAGSGEDGEEEATEEGGTATEGDEETNINFFFGEEGGDESEGDEAKPVQELSLRKVIQEICKNNNLNFRIEPYAVVIASKNVALDDCVTEFYTIDKEALESDGVCNGDINGDSLKEFFQDRRGVPFEGNAKIQYDEKTNKLIVTNTPENQRRIAELVRELNISNPQVQVQVKFVEVSLSDLEELGFEYTFSRVQNSRIDESQFSDIGYAEGETSTTFTATKGQILMEQQRTAASDNQTTATIYDPFSTSGTYYLKNGQTVTVNKQDNVNYKLFTPEGDTDTTHTFQPNDQLVRNAYDNPQTFGLDSGRTDSVFDLTYSNDDGYVFNAQIHALDQADSSDTLASPRVTTIAGETATIKMVTEKYYPESWGDAEMDDVNGRSVFIPSTPEFGDPVEEGVMLEVTPNIVDDEKYTLEMEMQPTILEFAGWTDYSYTVLLGEENTPKLNTLKMPIIQARSVKTKISSYDKATVTLGGIIKDKVNSVDDQYPILGDIPIVGRLFQSRGKNSVKTNLLIFMTGTMVNSDGTLFRPDDGARGVPQF